MIMILMNPFSPEMVKKVETYSEMKDDLVELSGELGRSIEDLLAIIYVVCSTLPSNTSHEEWRKLVDDLNSIDIDKIITALVLSCLE